jgi:hypothetical protein
MAQPEPGATKRGPKQLLMRHPVSKSRKELISDLLLKIEQQLDVVKTKVTLADFIRLIQLQRELEKEEQPAEVIVTWRDAPETSNTG